MSDRLIYTFTAAVFVFLGLNILTGSNAYGYVACGLGIAYWFVLLDHIVGLVRRDRRRSRVGRP